MICSYFEKNEYIEYLSEQCFATTERISLLAIDKVASKLELKTISLKISVNSINNIDNSCITASHWPRHQVRVHWFRFTLQLECFLSVVSKKLTGVLRAWSFHFYSLPHNCSHFAVGMERLMSGRISLELYMSYLKEHCF